jgi:hypothetical protein
LGRHRKTGKTGLCPRCLRIRGLSKHHAFPRRFFGNGNGNQSTLFLCGECHDEIEVIIPQSFRLSKEQYLELHRQFLRGFDFETLSGLVRRYQRKKTDYKNNRAVVLLKVTNIPIGGNDQPRFRRKKIERKAFQQRA